MTKKFLSESNKALARVAKYQSQVDSTKRLSGIADDPQGTLMAMKARNKLSNLDLYRSNISTAVGYLKEAESATSALNLIVQSAYDDIISAQSGAKTPEDLKILAEDLKNLQAEVFSISNTSLGTSYIFGGYNYTGKTSGVTKTSPFTISAGHLIYNGIDMTQLSWKDEFDKRIDEMSNLDTSVTNDLESTILDIASKFSATNTDEYTKKLAASAQETLDAFVSNGKAALDAARGAGIDASNANYQVMSEFLYGKPDLVDPDIHIPGIVDIAESLRAEAAKEMPVEGVTYTPDEALNLFDKTKIIALVGDLQTMLTGDATNTATRDLQDDITAAWGGQQALLDAEAAKTTKIQVGLTQSVDMTLTGLDLLGTGSDNLYHILGKAVQMLESGASPEGLSNMLTTLQKAQSSVLTLGTKIGATQNRMELIGNRYESSELNYTKMRSDAEDADMAESIVNLTTAQTVYNAALAGGAELLKVSLIDFLR